MVGSMSAAVQTGFDAWGDIGPNLAVITQSLTHHEPRPRLLSLRYTLSSQMQQFNLHLATVENSLRDDMQPADG